jgi:ElaA protein
MSTPQWKIKRFEALSLSELYAILQLRSEVFIVEQNCPYQDVDGKDQKALHLIGEFEGKLWPMHACSKPAIILKMLRLVAWSLLKITAKKMGTRAHA